MAFSSLIEKANNATVTLQGDAELVATAEDLADVDFGFTALESSWEIGAPRI